MFMHITQSILIMELLIECKKFYSNGKISVHYYTKNNMRQGPYTSYYDSGKICVVCNYDNDLISGRYLLYNSKGILVYDTHYKNNYEYNYTKRYDNDGLLVEHIVYNNCGDESIEPSGVCAEYFSNSTMFAGELCLYYFRHITQYHNNRYIIYDTRESGYNIMISGVIEPIRTLQKHFKKKFKKRLCLWIFNILNDVIEINDLSRLIILYM
jgi:hypothetical protein